MSRGVNKFIGIGNCCADPSVTYMPSGAAVTNITIACNEEWKDKQTGQKQERAEFVRVVFFNKLAEIAGEYLRKGSQVYVEGSLRTRKWQDQNGQDRYTTEIVASEMQMMGSPSGSQNSGQQNYPEAQQTDGVYNPDGSAMSPQQMKAAQQAAPHPPASDFED